MEPVKLVIRASSAVAVGALLMRSVSTGAHSATIPSSAAHWAGYSGPIARTSDAELMAIPRGRPLGLGDSIGHAIAAIFKHARWAPSLRSDPEDPSLPDVVVFTIDTDLAPDEAVDRLDLLFDEVAAEVAASGISVAFSFRYPDDV